MSGLIIIFHFTFLVKILIMSAQENEEPIVPDVTPAFNKGMVPAENKTAVEQVLEECMEEFVECISIARDVPICGENEQHEEMDFVNLCDMEYENCKDSEANWHYLKDGECQ